MQSLPKILLVLIFSIASFAQGNNSQQVARQPQAPKQPGPETTPPMPPSVTPTATSKAPAAETKELVGFAPSLMDKSADPCVDFYRYSCGGWLAQNPIPPDQASYGRDTELAERNRLILRDILENAAVQRPDRTRVEQKIGDYYYSCMDEKAIEQKGIDPLKPELDRIAAIKSKSELAELLAHLHLLGVDAFFSYGSDQDFKDATSVIAEADQGGLGLPERDYYTRTDAKSVGTRTQYVTHVAKMLQLVGESPRAAHADAQKVMAIETALAKASLTVTERRNPASIYHKLPLSNLEKINPAFGWNRYLHATDTPPVENLNVAVPDFFKGLEAVFNQEDLPTIKTYLRWHLIHQMAPMLPANFVAQNFDFYGQKLQGQKELQARWKRCVRSTDHQLGEALGQKYVQREFAPENKERTLRMVKDIESAMARDIDQLSWMSPETKRKAKEKLEEVANKIGYPDKWRDYSNYEVIRGDAIGNYIRGTEFESRRQIAKIGKPVDRSEWGMSPPTVNAYYNPQMNDINFPAGILQPPYYDPKADDAVNYGDSGGVIGHELTHGFDDEGSQFDGQGNLANWWTEADRKEFDTRTACVAHEYDQFIAVDNVHLNGKLTLGENVADIGGLKLAFMAYLARAAAAPDKNQSEEGFTPEQRFFLGYGQGWCENDTPEILRLQAQTDPHSTAKYRVNGVVSNLPEFQKAFSCKNDSARAPEKRCEVW